MFRIVARFPRILAKDGKTCGSRETVRFLGMKSFRLSFKGTKWCGNGDKASNDEDLGYFRETDACCREHDKCPTNIAGRETKYGLTNPDATTRSHCDCDKKFFDCLKKASSRLSRTIGELYFNFLSKKCFRRKECPAGK